jgi:hypothetical protein
MEDKIQRNIYFKIAIFAFVLYLFIKLFGTQMPFQEKVDDGGPLGGGQATL